MSLTKGRSAEDIALVDDLRVFMMVILRLNDGKSIENEPSKKKELFGYVNSEGKFVIRLNEVGSIHKHFEPLYSNNLQF